MMPSPTSERKGPYRRAVGPGKVKGKTLTDNVPTIHGVRVLDAIRNAAAVISEHLDLHVRFARDGDGLWVAYAWPTRRRVRVEENGRAWDAVRLEGGMDVVGSGWTLAACVQTTAIDAGVVEQTARELARKIVEAMG